MIGQLSGAVQRDETKTIKPGINEAFVAFSEDIMTDYNDSCSLFTRCTTPCKYYHVCICETPNNPYSTQLKTRV